MTNFARELWRRLETLHAVTYFAPESLDTAAELGVRGFWRCYFGYRAAPLGACSAGTVTAAFFGFAPSMVERAIPSVWELATPTDLISARTTSAATALRRLAGDELEAALESGWLLETLDAASRSASPGGHPMFAANRALDRPDDPVAALWQLATNLREQRGDSHVNAWASRGFDPLEVAVLFVADGGTTRKSLQPHRGWTDDEWADTDARLERRGLVSAGSTTERGAAIRAEVERVTDELAERPFASFDAADRQRVLDVLERPASAVARSEIIPSINPMGVPLLD
ncbi:MAG: hypothetical protein HKN41_07960 [Ilumatobacter sp.]|nr:hypothetical protein [Ilumatobacter sp.]